MHEWNSGNKTHPNDNVIDSLGAVDANLKYKKGAIDHAVYIKVFPDGTVSYITFSADDILNAANNKTAFPELRRVLEEALEIKFREGYILK